MVELFQQSSRYLLGNFNNLQDVIVGNREKERVKSMCFTVYHWPSVKYQGIGMTTIMGKAAPVCHCWNTSPTHTTKHRWLPWEWKEKAGLKWIGRWNLPQKLSPRWAHLHQPACQALSLHHGWQRRQLVPLDQTACDTCWRSALARRDYDPHAIVATSSHWPATSVHHEAHQKPARDQRPN